MILGICSVMYLFQYLIQYLVFSREILLPFLLFFHFSFFAGRKGAKPDFFSFAINDMAMRLRRLVKNLTSNS